MPTRKFKSRSAHKRKKIASAIMYIIVAAIASYFMQQYAGEPVFFLILYTMFHSLYSLIRVGYDE